MILNEVWPLSPERGDFQMALNIDAADFKMNEHDEEKKKADTVALALVPRASSVMFICMNRETRCIITHQQ